MRPIFTIHAGEYVFGEAFQKRFPKADLWVPAKDKGTDFLITEPSLSEPISVQVKMSKDYSKTQAIDSFEKSRKAGGWFTFSHDKIANSPAQIWTIVLISTARTAKPVFINIRPEVLLGNLCKVHGKQKSYNVYPWLMEINSKIVCVEGRSLKEPERNNLADGGPIPDGRDWTQHYENWEIFGIPE